MKLYLAYALTAVVSITATLMVLIASWPFNVLDIYKASVPGDPIVAGEVVDIRFEYCKHLDVPVWFNRVVLRVEGVDVYIDPLPPPPIVYNAPRCGRVTVPVFKTPIGRLGHSKARLDYTYKIGPRTLTGFYWTPSFVIVKGDSK